MDQEHIQIVLTALVVAVAVFFIVRRIYRMINSGNTGSECTKCGPEKIKG
jgi:large-conductance mechanosensitive channel